MTAISANLRAASAYLARGWAPTPVESGAKRPLLRDWPRRRLNEADLGLFTGCNVGLVLGEASGGLVDVDCDWPEAAELASELLPPTGLVHGRATSRASHWWYRSGGATSRVFRLEGQERPKRPVVELRAEALLTVVPPSVHPTGERLVWERWGEPTAVAPAVLQLAVARLAVAAVLRSRGWPAREAVWLARRPAVEIARSLGQTLGSQVPLRAWLGLGETRRQDTRPSSPGKGGELAPGRASPLTEAVLVRLGGVVGAARLLGLSLREGRQRCPFHGGNSERAFQVTRHAWRCWGGCGKGNAIHLAAHALACDYREARRRLAHQLGLRTRFHPPTPPR